MDFNLYFRENLMILTKWFQSNMKIWIFLKLILSVESFHLRMRCSPRSFILFHFEKIKKLIISFDFFENYH